MKSFAARVASQYLRAARPVPLDKAYLQGVSRDLAKFFIAQLRKAAGDRQTAWQHKRLQAYRRGHGVAFEFPKRLHFESLLRRGHGFETDPVDLPLWVMSGERGAPRGRSRFVQGGSFVQYDQPWVEIRVYPDVTGEQLEKDERLLAREFYDVLLHEATHVVELARDERHEGTRQLDPGEKVNSPVEVRAYMQQIAEDAIEAMREGLGARDAIALSPTWSRVDRWLTEKNRRLIQKGVYTALRDEGLV